MAEDSASRWTRRALFGAVGATAAVVAAERLGLLNSDVKPDQMLPGEVKLSRIDPIRTSPSIPEGDKNVSNPNIASWDEVEEMKGKDNLTVLDVPLILGQNPNGPGQAEWAKVRLTQAGVTGGLKIFYIPAELVFQRNPTVTPIKVDKVENGAIKTIDGRTFMQDQVGRVPNPQASK